MIEFAPNFPILGSTLCPILLQILYKDLIYENLKNDYCEWNANTF